MSEEKQPSMAAAGAAKSSGTVVAAFRNILLCGATTSLGTVEISDKGLQWSNGEGRIAKVKAGDVRSLEWVPQGPARAQLRIRSAGDRLLLLDGFDPRTRERLTESLAACMEGAGVKEPPQLQDGTMAVGGGHWGEPAVVGRRLELFDAKGRPMCFLPLDGLAHLAYPGRGEVELQYEADDTAAPDDEVLMEMRLWVPPGHPKWSEEGKLAAGEGESSSSSSAADTPSAAGKSAAEALQAAMAEVADLGGGESSGDLVAEIPEAQALFLTPRGRYKMELYPTAMRLVGKTYEYRLAYKSISRMFYLPRPSQTTADSTRVNIVISLDDPIRQGLQRYPHLVLQLDVVHAAIDVLASTEARTTKYGGIGSKVEGDLPKVVASLLRSITGKRIFRPGEFVSSTGHKAIRCALKGNDGLLYPLDRSFFFIHKPATYVRHQEVVSIEMQRMGMGASGVASRTFDMVIRCKGLGGEQGREYTFSSIERKEHAGLLRFLRGKKLEVSTDEDDGSRQQRIGAMLGGDDEDDDGRRAARGGGGGGGGGDAMDDDEEEDSDFEEGGGEEDSSSEDDDDEAGSGGGSGSEDDSD